MKRIFYLIFLIASFGCITSCMQNNGYIGDLYGIWRLESITANGTTEECDSVFFAFQSDIIQIRKVTYDIHKVTLTTGLYTRQNNMLKVNLYHYEGHDVTNDVAIAQMLQNLACIYIDEVSPLFAVEELTGKEMILEYQERVYKFTKLN